MKNNNILIALISFLVLITNSYAQGPGKWSKPIPHPCYKGLLVSVVNMGYNENRKDYPWGVRIINNYKIPVSFKYLLSVGGEKMGSTKFQYSVADKLGAGKEEIDGKDLFTAISFQSSSDDWTVMIGEVCFDRMRCGGEDECYAECDKDVENPKPNQPCGLSDAAASTNTKNEFEPSYVKGTEPDEDDGGAKEEVSEKPILNKPEERTILIKNGLWKVICPGSEYKANIKMVNGEILWTETTSLEFPPHIFIKKGPNEYGFEGRTDFRLIVKDPETINRTINGVTCNDFKFVSETEEKKAEETTTNNGDKYNYKGTTIWKSKSGRYRLFAVIDNWLYQVSEGGGPWKYGTHFWQLRDMKSFFPKKAPDTYEYIIDKEFKEIITFIEPDKLQDDNYNKHQNKLWSTDIYTLADKWSSESLPQATKQNISSTDINDTWNQEKAFNEYLKLSVKLLSQDGDKIILTKNSETFTYKKTSANTYEYKPEDMAGTARLVFLSPTRICLSYVYKNYVSIGYYNKPAAPPIVKQENKPVTENKTASGNSGICGKWSLDETQERYYGSYIIDVTCTGDMLSIRYEKDLSKLYQGTLATGTITTAQKTSGYYYGVSLLKNEPIYLPAWSGICPFKTENEQTNLPGTWIYLQNEYGELLTLKVGNIQISFKKVK